jgi:hypothetical protein
MDCITESHVYAFYEIVQQLIGQNSKPTLQESDIVNFLDSLQNSINEDFKAEFYLPSFIQQLSNLVVLSIPNKDKEECDLHYHNTDGNLENRMWGLALICTSWIIINLKRKTEEGHCRKHRDMESNIPCKLSTEFHNEIYLECIKSFEQIIKVAKQHPPSFT